MSRLLQEQVSHLAAASIAHPYIRSMPSASSADSHDVDASPEGRSDSRTTCPSEVAVLCARYRRSKDGRSIIYRRSAIGLQIYQKYVDEFKTWRKPSCPVNSFQSCVPWSFSFRISISMKRICALRHSSNSFQNYTNTICSK